jgi:hypothetical protein
MLCVPERAAAAAGGGADLAVVRRLVSTMRQ